MDKDDPLLLENQLCFPLYACSREIVKVYRPWLDELGITYTQYITLMVLWEEQQISVKDLGARLRLDSGTLTPLLKKLEAKGYLHRQRSVSDERVVLACITEAGNALKARAQDIPLALKRYLQSFPQEKSRELYRLLYELIGVLDASAKK
ncbi:MAG: MarR family transcriptional regulator [Selenomonas sp.]|jgi:DNA-binding MarR family transcriptional regulator|nr:MarR family transcriptional regulator [Selenomonas sp.]MCI7330889.1 MarR family transcriptional regulator [Selenomonadaceae bacterium]MDD6120894.1 MarR family transcriptional regulator [Selenomonadaceae bacterium]MDD7057381.1 MarR family transcriptional regulator [Selenomonadaceae bacterium]MDY3916173.1 MarR family transcriptional regulator [Selenomonadaceae bacterium]